MTVVQALNAVMEDVLAVRKGDRNDHQGFNFRGIDAVMNAVGPALRKHGVVVFPSLQSVTYREVEVGQKRTLQRECTMEVQFTAYGPEGDYITGTVAAEALDSGDKATSKAHSVAYRTFLLQALTIPTDEPDPDMHTVERASRPEPQSNQNGDEPISAANRAAFIEKVEGLGLEPAVVVYRATDGRTDDPAQLRKNEVPAAKAVMDALAAAKADGPEASPASGPSITGSQVTKLAISMKQAGMVDDDQRYAWLSERVGRPVTSSKDLSKAEASACIDELSKAAAP